MARRVLLVLLSIALVTMGVLHFAATDAFAAVMPPYLPWHRELVWISGIAEIVCGVGLLPPRTRPWAGWATVALLLAVFPANVHMAVSGTGLPGQPPPPAWVLWARLPLQAVFVAWAVWASEATGLLRRAKPAA